MNKRVFLIHGWGGYPEEGWRPWLKNELEKRSFKVYVPKMPDTNNPRLNAWLEELKKIVETPDKNCYFVGHSLGCITILRYLETLGQNQQIGGVVLVAGFTDINITIDGDENINEIKTFFEKEINFDKIKTHCKKFVAIHSDNDPFVPLRYADILKEELNAKVIIQNNMKHFSGSDGITKLPIAFSSILEMAGDSTWGVV